MKEKIIKGKAIVRYGDDKILRLKMLPKSNIEAKAAQQILAAVEELVGDQWHGNLVDTREMTFISGEARKMFAQHKNQKVAAVAIVFNSRLHKALVSLYFKFSAPRHPTKAFENEQQAEKWLKTKI